MSVSSKITSELDKLFAGRRPTRWVTRERPKIDRIACPWLILRFIDPKAEFLYVAATEVFDTAAREKAAAYDIPGAPFEHHGERCSFDAFIERFTLTAPGLDYLAKIVRGADTSRLDLTPESPGLYAMSLGLSRMYVDDHEMLSQGLVMYDALYAWLLQAREEKHNWPPAQ